MWERHWKQVVGSIALAKLEPLILRVLLAISGLWYQIDNFAAFLSLAFAARLEPYFAVTGMAELLIALWLPVKKQQASAAGASNPHT